MTGSVNRVQLIGRVGKDPEQKSFGDGGQVTTFSLAMTETWKTGSGEKRERTEWANISIYNDALAEVAKRHVKKGDLLYVEGKLSTRSWEKDGEKRYATEIALGPYGSDLQMLGSPNRPEGGTARAQRAEPSGRR